MVQVYDDENYFMSYRMLDIRSESLEVLFELFIGRRFRRAKNLRGNYE